MVAAMNLLGGIAFDPTIRGWLVVLTGTIVLMGSVWLLLATNSGVRLGTLLALAGFFGWMAIMGFIWWIYGIGWIGDAPTWEPVDVAVGTTSQSALEEARTLPDRDDIVVGLGGEPFELVAASDNEEAKADWDPTLDETETEGLTDEEIEYREDQSTQRILNRNYSDVEATAPEIIDENDPLFGGWTLNSTADAGEAQASALALLVDGGFLSADDPIIFAETYEQGGKDDLPDEPTRWDRISLTVENFVRFRHPTRYTIVQVQPAVMGETPPGQPPAADIPDERAELLSVVMVRDLGDRRLPPFMVMVGSTAIFLALALMLHVRDVDAEDRKNEFEASLE